jgi:hypothetical protein
VKEERQTNITENWRITCNAHNRHTKKEKTMQTMAISFIIRPTIIFSNV